MPQVIDLKPNINSAALDIIEEIKERVESGDIQSIAIAYVTKDNGISGDWSGSNNQLLQWSAINHIERSFYKEAVLCED